jgi:hypothetical protein
MIHDKFSVLVARLIEYRAGVSKVPIMAQSWEEIIWATLAYLFGEDEVAWDPQSHEQSIDIRVGIGARILNISAKAGQIRNGVLTVSSYRLTSFISLAQMLDFVRDQHSNFDLYLICARELRKTDVSYMVFQVPSQRLCPVEFTAVHNWEKTNAGYNLRIDVGFNAKIVFKMSNQLWYSIPLNYFKPEEVAARVSLPLEAVGRGLIDYLRQADRGSELR